MGWFNFFKRKPRPVDDFDNLKDIEASLNERENSGPSPHYAFAHLALRQIALDDPLFFLMALANPDAKAFLREVLEHVHRSLECPPAFTAEEIEIETCRLGEYPCAILKLPEPREMAEAHFVALVLLHRQDEGPPREGSPVRARYFTLEKGLDDSGKLTGTVLCEWTATSHLNFGKGPPATTEDFAKAMKRMLVEAN